MPTFVSSSGVRAEASNRAYANRHSTTNAPLRAGADELAVRAEQAFCDALGIDWELERPIGKTPGWQFIINGTTVKVFATSPGRNLLVKEGKANAEVYVLCWVRGEDAWVEGWCERALVEACPVQVMKEDGPYRQPAHFVSNRVLDRDTDRLKRRLGLAVRSNQLGLW